VHRRLALSETQRGGKLQRARRKLVRDSRQWQAKAGGRSRTVAPRSVEAHKVGVIENVESLGAEMELNAFGAERERALEERIETVDRAPVACVSSHHNSVDHRTIRRRASGPAIGSSGREVIRKARRQSRYPAEPDFPKRGIEAAEHEAIALVVDRIRFLLRAREIGIVGVLAGNVRIHIIHCMRPGIARQHRESVAETMTEVQVQCTIKSESVVPIALKSAVGGSNAVRGIKDPQGSRRIGGIGGACGEWCVRGVADCRIGDARTPTAQKTLTARNAEQMPIPLRNAIIRVRKLA
jgi:hypothetical protein